MAKQKVKFYSRTGLDSHQKSKPDLLTEIFKKIVVQMDTKQN